jgi:hypothetical protein
MASKYGGDPDKELLGGCLMTVCALLIFAIILISYVLH